MHNVDTMDCKIIHPTDTEFSVSHVSKDVILHPSPVSLRTFSNLIDGVEVIKQFSKKKQTRTAFKFSQNLRQDKADKKMFTLTEFCLFK